MPPSFEELPEIDITEEMNSNIPSGVQEKPFSADIDMPESVQELDVDGDFMETLAIALTAAEENGEEAVITCQEKESETCLNLRNELVKRQGRGSIESFNEDVFGEKVTFHIIPASPEASNETIAA
jgi:hypothetical protein